MSRSDTPERDAAAIIDECVTVLRNRGHTRQAAARDAAVWLNTSFRRVQSLLFGEPVRVDDAELTELRAAYARLLDDEARDLERRMALTRARLNEIRGELHDNETTTAVLATSGTRVYAGRGVGNRRGGALPA